MSNNNNQTGAPMQLTITQDKLVDLLLHAATREDIARLDAKIDSKFTELDSKISNLDSKFEAKFDKLDAKIDKLTWLIIGSILVPILLHFIH
ncbi:MAG: hypothetical protein K2Y14_02520 [Burkholderiales bacterium]|nr:hypothetical protein [Burkholderiales bacterium]